MPTVHFNGRDIECEEGERLRDVLLAAGESPHNDAATTINCRGFGTCGTCAVEILKGDPPEKTAREHWRLDFPPHDADAGLRPACQVRVTSDMTVRKYPGFWGQHTDDHPTR